MNYTEQQIAEFKRKADKWDALRGFLSIAYNL